MKMFAEFLRILLLEGLQNIGFIAAFIYAAYMWGENRVLAVAVIVVGMTVGNLIMGITEPIIHKEPANFKWQTTILVNTVMFCVFAVLGISYIHWQEKQHWDLIVSVGFGLAVAIIQGLFNSSEDYGMMNYAIHSLAMGLSFFIFILGTRWAIAEAPGGGVVLARAFLLNLVGSAIIVVVDYGYLVVGTNA